MYFDHKRRVMAARCTKHLQSVDIDFFLKPELRRPVISHAESHIIITMIIVFRWSIRRSKTVVIYRMDFSIVYIST